MGDSLLNFNVRRRAQAGITAISLAVVAIAHKKSRVRIAATRLVSG